MISGGARNRPPELLLALAEAGAISWLHSTQVTHRKLRAERRRAATRGGASQETSCELPANGAGKKLMAAAVEWRRPLWRRLTTAACRLPNAKPPAAFIRPLQQRHYFEKRQKEKKVELFCSCAPSLLGRSESKLVGARSIGRARAGDCFAQTSARGLRKARATRALFDATQRNPPPSQVYTQYRCLQSAAMAPLCWLLFSICAFAAAETRGSKSAPS